MANPIYHYKYIENDRQKWYNLIARKPTKEAVIIYRQEILQDISLFTSQPKANFYDSLFFNLELPESFCKGKTTGRKGFPKSALLCAFIVMKCEDFSQITDLADYLDNNRLIAYYCGFDITQELPSYWTYDRFIRNIDNELLQKIMHSQVLKLAELGIIDTSFIALDSTPVSANTKHNNPKSFVSNKFSKDNPPASDKDCALGVHTASNQHPVGNLICDAGLAMHKDGKTKDNGRTRQKFCCPYKNSKTYNCPCNHKNWNNGKKNRGCTKYITIPDDYRLSIDRTSIQFKSVYSLRTEAERYNSRFKSTGQEHLWVRNGYSAKNLNTVAHIALLAIALAAVITKSGSSYRSFKNCKRTA